MDRIKPPKHIQDYPDRFLDCQESMEEAIKAVLEQAVAAGWEPEEVHCALVELADNLLLTAIATRRKEITDDNPIGGR